MSAAFKKKQKEVTRAREEEKKEGTSKKLKHSRGAKKTQDVLPCAAYSTGNPADHKHSGTIEK